MMLEALLRMFMIFLAQSILTKLARIGIPSNHPLHPTQNPPLARPPKQLTNHPTQPPIARFMVIPRMPVLPHGKALHGERARAHG